MAEADLALEALGDLWVPSATGDPGWASKSLASPIRGPGSFKLTESWAHVNSQAKDTAHIIKLCLRNSLGEMSLESSIRPKKGNCLMKSIGLLCDRKREWSGLQEAQCLLGTAGSFSLHCGCRITLGRSPTPHPQTLPRTHC